MKSKLLSTVLGFALSLAAGSAFAAGELHIYSRGGHGYGLRTSDDAVSTWPYRLEAWLRANAWIK